MLSHWDTKHVIKLQLTLVSRFLVTLLKKRERFAIFNMFVLIFVLSLPYRGGGEESAFLLGSMLYAGMYLGPTGSCVFLLSSALRQVVIFQPNYTIYAHT
jgi:hypothetical protein